MKKDELLSLFPTPVQIYKYEDSIEKELKHIEVKGELVKQISRQKFQ